MVLFGRGLGCKSGSGVWAVDGALDSQRPPPKSQVLLGIISSLPFVKPVGYLLDAGPFSASRKPEMAGMCGMVDRSCGHLHVHAVVYPPVHRGIARWPWVWCEDDSVADSVAAIVTNIV